MISVNVENHHIAEYQQLLTSEWDKDFPNAVLSLLWSVLSFSPPREETSAIVDLLNPNSAKDFPSEKFDAIVQRIVSAAQFLRFTNLPAAPVDIPIPKRLPKKILLAHRLICYLALPAYCPLSGDEEFFVDGQALAFQAALHFVLPSLRQKHEAQHSLLLHAAVLFATGYATYDLAHSTYMISSIHDYLGDEQQRLRTLYASFRFTEPSDHSYMTKAQEVWTELVDRQKYDLAEDFLFKLHWQSLPEHQDEVREMIGDAMKFMSSQKRK